MKHRSARHACALALILIAGCPQDTEAQNVVQTGPGLPPYEILTIVRSRGLDPLGPPMRRGSIYVLHAIDVGGEDVRVIVDARNGRIQSIEPVMQSGRDWPPRRAGMPPYPPYDLPPRVRVLPPDYDDFDTMPPPAHDYGWGRPPPARTPPLRPPPAATPELAKPAPAKPEPAARSAAVTPVRPPLPRPRPAAKAAVEAAPPPPPARAAPPPPAETKPPAPARASPAPAPESKSAPKPTSPPVVGFD